MERLAQVLEFGLESLEGEKYFNQPNYKDDENPKPQRPDLVQ
jgi:hypothetical protein